MKIVKTFVLSLALMCSISQAETKGLPGDSLFQIQSKWLNQEGREIDLQSLRGRPVILAMVYLTCHYLCPTVVSHVSTLREKLKPQTRARVQTVLVSFDPGRDTPQVMQAYIKKHKLEGWTFITNKSDSKLRELTSALNFKFKKTDDGEFTHSFVIAVLNADGVVAARVDNVQDSDAPLVAALEKLAAP